MDERALRIESRAEKCVSSITQALNNAGITEACYAVRVRVKTEDRLKEKVFRKREREGRPDYSLESITDVIGIRLITLFRSELASVLEKVLDLIDHEIPLQPHPLKKDSLEELIVYSNQLPNSPFVNEIRERVTNRQREIELKNSEEGYSSLHVVCRIAPSLIDCKLIGEDYKLPVEIQIRTVFEDAWGEIDHKYGYLARSGKAEVGKQEQALTAPHLVVLKEFTEACASYADAIKQMSLPVNPLSSGSGKVMAVESDVDVATRFEKLKVPTSLIEAYQRGRDLRESAAQETDMQINRTAYLEAHTYFEDLYKSAAEQNFSEDSGKRLYLYYIALNSAYCLLSVGTPNSVDRAIAIYNALMQEHSDYPMVRMRLSQAMAKSGQDEAAIVMMENVWSEVKVAGKSSEESGSWTDRLPKADYNHICKTLPKLLGYAYWAKAVYRTPENLASTRVELLRKAYEITSEAADSDSVSIVNNLAYYAVDFLRLQDTGSFAESLKKVLPNYLTLLQSAAGDSAGNGQLRLLDTMLEIHSFLGNSDEAVELATEIGRKLKEQIERDEAVSQRISQRVIDVLTEHTAPNGAKTT